MLDNIKAHSTAVAQVAQMLYQELAKNPTICAKLPPINLVLAGALLHDIAKTPCLESRCDHAKQGRDICLNLGYPEVAEVVREHVRLVDFPHSRFAIGHFMARDIVYYADKRVCHTTVVPIAKRLDYILKRYGNNDPERYRIIKENFNKCQRLENCFLQFINITSDEINASQSTLAFTMD